MKRAAPLFVLLAAVLAAGVVVRTRRGSETRESARSPVPSETLAPRPAASTRAAMAPPPAPAPLQVDEPTPASSADGPARREDADRLIAAGKIVEGIDVFRKVVEADPTAKNHGDLGSLLYRLTALDEAAIHLRAAAELDPGNADRWIALANVYYRKVDPGEAWKAEKRAREAEPGLELGRDGAGMRVRKGEAAPRNQ